MFGRLSVRVLSSFVNFTFLYLERRFLSVCRNLCDDRHVSRLLPGPPHSRSVRSVDTQGWDGRRETWVLVERVGEETDPLEELDLGE